MRRTLLLLAALASIVGPSVASTSSQAQVIEDHRFCSDTAVNVVFYLDVTTPYDSADQQALVSGIGQIFDGLEDGGRLSIRTIEDAFSSSERLLDMCVPFCSDRGFFGNLFSDCTEGVVINERKKLRADIRLALAHRLQSASELPHSEIIRTISTSSAEEFRAGRENRFYIFSDMIENSEYLSGKTFFADTTAALLARVKKDNLIPSLAGANVAVFGFGRNGVTGSRSALSQDFVKKLTSFWTGYFSEAGATLTLRQNLGTE